MADARRLQLRAITESAFQADVLTLFRMAGWRVAHHHDSRRQVRPGVFVGDTDAAGLPDLIAVRSGDFLMAELKTERGKASDEQLAWLEDLDAAGIDAYLWRPHDMDDIISRARGGPRREHRAGT